MTEELRPVSGDESGRPSPSAPLAPGPGLRAPCDHVVLTTPVALGYVLEPPKTPRRGVSILTQRAGDS